MKPGENEIRFDLQIIASWIEPGSKVLGLGCGEGELLHFLKKSKGVKCTGIELNEDKVAKCIEKGLTVLTGETGAGKSILLDALNLALGDRADTSVIRHGAEKAEISVTFQTDDHSEAETWLKANELHSENECIIRRVISNNGPSKAFINGKPAPIQTLRELDRKSVV